MDVNEKLKSFLDEKGRLTAFPVKRKKKLYSLVYIARSFEIGKDYSEQEINDIINTVTLFDDPATIRRELYGNRFLTRKKDCTVYRKLENQPTLNELGLEE